MRHETIRDAFSLHFFRRFSESQRFGLGEDIGQQHPVMPAQGIEGLKEGNEVTRDQSRALMNQLIKGMLAVGSRFTPVDGTGLVVGLDSVQGDVFAVALHGQLLKIGRKSLQILVVGQDRHGPERRRNCCTRQREDP